GVGWGGLPGLQDGTVGLEGAAKVRSTPAHVASVPPAGHGLQSPATGPLSQKAPHTVATLSTQLDVQLPEQQLGVVWQMLVTHGSQLDASLAPVAHLLCAHVPLEGALQYSSNWQSRAWLHGSLMPLPMKPFGMLPTDPLL